jgi:hypothetical protein
VGYNGTILIPWPPHDDETTIYSCERLKILALQDLSQHSSLKGYLETIRLWICDVNRKLGVIMFVI